MSTSESFRALRRANPRTKPGFSESVETAAGAVRAGIALSAQRAPEGATGRPRRRRLLRVSAAGATLAVAAGAAAALTISSLGGSPGVEDASAAVKKAALVSAASAERSGTARIRITHDGALWAGKTVRWHGANISISGEPVGPYRKAGDELLVVDGLVYGPDPEVEGGWLEMGSPSNIDPDSGTTPGEYLAAVKEDIGGATLRRIMGAMKGLTVAPLDDSSTVYSGTVAAGLIARETGFKDRQALRVLPFGYVAHDEAANPVSPLDVAVTVGADGIVRQIAVSWGSSGSAWRCTVTYGSLGTAPALVAPENVRSLLKMRLGTG